MTSTVTRQSLVASRRTDRPMARLSAVALAIVLVGAGAGHPAAGALLVVGGFPVGRVEHESRVADEAPGDAGAARPLARAATPAVGAAAGTEVLVGADAGGGFVMHVSFDDSITNDPNAAAIESAVVDAARTYVSLLTDPITVSIRFRYATTRPDGTPLGTGLLAESQSCLYRISWASYVDALVTDATTPNDTLATASLPAEPLSVQIYPTSANGRAVGLDLPPVMFADGNLGPGGPYDGIVTINALKPFSFTRPPAPQTYDAQRSIEHEIDEVLGRRRRGQIEARSPVRVVRAGPPQPDDERHALLLDRRRRHRAGRLQSGPERRLGRLAERLVPPGDAVRAERVQLQGAVRRCQAGVAGGHRARRRRLGRGEPDRQQQHDHHAIDVDDHDDDRARLPAVRSGVLPAGRAGVRRLRRRLRQRRVLPDHGPSLRQREPDVPELRARAGGVLPARRARMRALRHGLR